MTLTKCFGARGILGRPQDICTIRDRCLRWTKPISSHQVFSGPVQGFTSKRGCEAFIDGEQGLQFELFSETQTAN